jgi:hypothetical protein
MAGHTPQWRESGSETVCRVWTRIATRCEQPLCLPLAPSVDGEPPVALMPADWSNELLASYVLYAYLQSERRDLLWLVNIIQVGNRPNLPQHHVSLDDFAAWAASLETRPRR